MIYNDMYAGAYRGNEHYCHAAFSMEKLKEMRRICETRHQHSRSGVHLYIFAGLVRCETCGNIMHGFSDRLKSGAHSRYYRCSKRYNRHSCTNSANVKEEVIENYLLNNVKRAAKNEIVKYDISKKQNRKPQQDRQKLKNKMRKLKDLYVNDLIDLNDYRRDYENYQYELEKLESVKAPEVNIERLQRLFDSDLVSAYDGLDREHKRSFWRSIIKEIYINEQKEIVRIIFL